MSEPGSFRILAQSGQARRARLETAHGSIETPVFMPVGTQATVKSLEPRDLLNEDCRVLLGNTYHLNNRPGAELVEQFGGLHSFMAWPNAILTDSGGFQVFSLAKLNRITDEGVAFQSHTDGRRCFIGPKESMDIQRRLGADIAMAFDECIPFPSTPAYAADAVRRTLAWAARCQDQERAPGQLRFGIVQGGIHETLRRECARELVNIGFDGYAIGGVSVGEAEQQVHLGVQYGLAELPGNKPRYLMGVGLFTQLIDAVALGVDMFDCVMPTRFARNGTAFTRLGRYPVKAAVYREDKRPVEEGCTCPCCAHFTRGYVRHLLNVDEMLGARLLSLHNIHCYMSFMADIRHAIEQDAFEDFRAEFTATYQIITAEHLANHQ